jgi:hypothetical protein
MPNRQILASGRQPAPPKLLGATSDRGTIITATVISIALWILAIGVKHLGKAQQCSLAQRS